MINAGIDEAGRGPVIGPMVIAFACFDENGIKNLKNLNVRDSKKILPNRRTFLEEKIKNIALNFEILKIPASELDELMKNFSLNEIEAIKISEIIERIVKRTNIDKIFIDSPDPVQNGKSKFKERIERILNKKNIKIKFSIICENYADSKYIECSAASILAKVERDREIEKLREIYGDFGSGYPSDEKTINFLKNSENLKKIDKFIRHAWKLNSINLENNKKEKQTKLF